MGTKHIRAILYATASKINAVFLFFPCAANENFNLLTYIYGRICLIPYLVWIDGQHFNF